MNRTTFLLLFFLPITLAAQNLLNKPEHVVFDPVSHCYLVTNYGNGKIVSIDTLGNQEVIIEGIPSCLGIHIIDTTIFITSGHNVHLYGLTSHGFIETIPLNVSNWVDGMTDDGDGHLYVAENAGKVHQVDLSTCTDTIIVDGGLPANPQDLAYDPDSHRLLLVCWGTNSPIISIDLATYEVSPLVETTSGQYDGIVRDSEGNLYVTSWMSGGRVYRWEPPYASEPTVFSQGHAGPAGLALNEDGQLLAVPNFNGNSISYLSLIPMGIRENNGKPVIHIERDQLVVNSSLSFRILITTINGQQVFMESYAPGEITLSLKSALVNNYRGYFILTVQNGSAFDSAKYYYDGN